MPYLLILILTISTIDSAVAQENNAPWGHSKVLDIKYQPQRVLYDIDGGDIEHFSGILDRISLLNKFYNADPFDSSITVVIHGEAIEFFAIQNTEKYRDLVYRAQQISLQGNIEFKLCAAAAKARYKWEAKDIHGFVKMVPMADAEIIRLQKEEGFAYMR